MNNKFILPVVAIIFIASFLLGNWLNQSDDNIVQFEKKNMQYLPCNPVMNKCQAMFENIPVSITFLQKPTALNPFMIEVRVDEPDIQEVRMDFRMPAMNMGVNFYRLSEVEEGIWKGDVTLPVCTSRRSDWVGELQIHYQEKLWVAEFAFTQSMDN